MKHLLIFLALILLYGYVKAENDSCITSIIIETDTLLINQLDTCEELVSSKIDTIVEIEVKEAVQKPLHTKLKKQKSLNTKNPEDFGSFFSDLWDAISSLWKPVWGYYEENGMNHSGPYFLFNRENGDHSKQMEKLRTDIINSQLNLEIYNSIFTSAGTSTINNCNGVLIPNPWDGSTLCEASKRAKASAFVYLVGLDGSGVALSTSDRNGYRDRALGYLKDVQAEGLNNVLDWFSWTPASILIDPFAVFGALSQWQQMVWRAKELQMICQAWDMIRWCNNIDPNLTSDYEQMKEAGNTL
jgi:hypothetical protein